jgi:hypothetical protein
MLNKNVPLDIIKKNNPEFLHRYMKMCAIAVAINFAIIITLPCYENMLRIE